MTSRKRRKQRREKIKTKNTLKKLAMSKPVKASNYIKYFKKHLTSNCSIKIILYCRVSRCWQQKNGNLRDQRNYLQKIIRKYGERYSFTINVINVFEETASGWDGDRKILIAAAQAAKIHEAILVAESTCRFIRNKNYHSIHNPEILPIIYEYESLINITEGVRLATIMPPNISWKKVKSFHTKRGQRSKKKLGGRPKVNKPGYKKKGRLEKLQQVLRLRKNGASWGDIFVLTNVPKSTAADWVKKYG